MEGYIGFIQWWFAGNYEPENWACCQGQLMSISQNSPLFAILGTTYGGDGLVNFALPDFRGRVAVGAGQGPGLSNYPLGQKGGSERTVITVDNLPPHTHSLNGNSTAGKFEAPAGKLLANTGNIDKKEYTTPGTMVTMQPRAIAPNGGNQPFDNRQPYLGMRFIICLSGIFLAPS